jgi:hypothetical protein
MNQLAPNPFKFGNPVEGDYYLPRPELFSTVRQFIENRIHIVLMGPRRFGKTSFVLNLLGMLEKNGYIPLVIQASVLPASDSHCFWDPPASPNLSG